MSTMGVSLLALTVNMVCLAVLRRYRHGEVHLQAAWTFSATDVQANLGVQATEAAAASASGSAFASPRA